MEGQELLNLYTNKRDYSGDAHDEYAQLLMTIFSNIGTEIFSLLEQAEAQGKKLGIREVDDIFTQDFISVDDIILI
jgi:hypothetical protein